MATAMDNGVLDAVLAQIRPLLGQGKVADYIPALASVSGNKLGIAISTVQENISTQAMPTSVFPSSLFLRCSALRWSP